MVAKNIVDLRKRASRYQSHDNLRLVPERPAPRPNGRRVSPVRTRRRRTRAILWLVLLIILMGAIYGVSWVSYLPQYSINDVGVTGTHDVSAQTISDYVQAQLHAGGHSLISPHNVLTYDYLALERGIVTSFPRIEEVHVSHASLLATAIEVTVQERHAFALWCTDDAVRECYYIDHTGFIFASAPPLVLTQSASGSTVASTSTINGDKNTLRYTFVGGLTATSSSPIGETFVGAHMPGVLSLLRLLEQAGFSPSGASVQNAQDFFVPLQEGYMIKVSFGEDANNVVQNLQLVLASDALQGKSDILEYIDLRFGNRVYYKLKGNIETTASSTRNTVR